MIKEVLNSCFDAGLNICASVCDLDGVNKKALGLLGASVENPCIEDQSSDNKQGIGIAKWSHIRQFYELDNNNPNFVYAPCLTKEHLDPNTKQKMRVKLAAQVLSHSVAAGIYSKIAKGDIPTEAVATANLITYMDELFDGIKQTQLVKDCLLLVIEVYLLRVVILFYVQLTYPVRQDRQERNILVRHVPLHLISRLEKVCACWRSATRELQRRDQQDSNRPEDPPEAMEYHCMHMYTVFLGNDFVQMPIAEQQLTILKENIEKRTVVVRKMQCNVYLSVKCTVL
ncbi:unnamed protein product [Parnassius apollo]|uniref:(apollo) hypothetical protein n=1 Tax=Parnassius apollo TaxID=110799 RepID=A0A8S3WSP4_PARAO|nr:unnamed protein product [Parnassius apollo]